MTSQFTPIENDSTEPSIQINAARVGLRRRRSTFAAWLPTIMFVLHALPAVPVLAVVWFFLRPALFGNPSVPSNHPASVPSSVSTSPRSVMEQARPSHPSAPQIQPSTPPRLSGGRVQTVTTEPSGQPPIQFLPSYSQPRPYIIPQSPQPANRGRAVEEFLGDLAVETPFGPAPIVPQHSWAGSHQAPSPWSTGGDAMHGTLTDPTDHLEIDGMFDEIRGRSFEGTSQFRDEPSRRVRLSIDRIRDRGGNLKARLTLLDSPHTTKPFVGVIDRDSGTLSLQADVEPGNIPMANMGVPWYSPNLSPRITFSSDDGKTLTGRSTVGDVFQLQPKQARLVRTRPAVEQGESSLPTLQQGEQLLYQLVRRNGRTLEADDQWLFVNTANSQGDFTWTHDGSTKADGTYQLYRRGDVQVLNLKIGRLCFRCQVSVKPERLTVWVPCEPPGTGQREDSDHVYCLEPRLH